MQAVTRGREAARIEAVLVCVNEYVRRGGQGEDKHGTDLIGEFGRGVEQNVKGRW